MGFLPKFLKFNASKKPRIFIRFTLKKQAQAALKKQHQAAFTQNLRAIEP